jgi:urease accessory protein
MRVFTERCLISAQDGDLPVLALPFETRQKSRFRAVLSTGEEVGIQIARGTILRGGDGLQDEHGDKVRLEAAPESLSMATGSDHLLLVRAAYHLGNRHVSVAFAEDRLFYAHDHVLDDMVRGLGLRVDPITAPFEPEPGAYSGHSSHGSGHGHEHGHGHGHQHGHEHG